MCLLFANSSRLNRDIYYGIYVINCYINNNSEQSGSYVGHRLHTISEINHAFYKRYRIQLTSKTSPTDAVTLIWFNFVRFRNEAKDRKAKKHDQNYYC